MMKTTQEVRRDVIKEIFSARLKESILLLNPIKITIAESTTSPPTEVKICFDEVIAGQEQRFSLQEKASSGFVDGIFTILHDKYNKLYPSIQNIKLNNYTVDPILNSAKASLCSDAKVRVSITSEIKGHGLVDFSSTSRSLIQSTFSASLKIFQFYINCERSFDILSKALKNAKERNRGDIVQSCIRDMSSLTQMNNYEPKEYRN